MLFTRIHPILGILSRQNHRHAIVNRRHHHVGRTGDNRKSSLVLSWVFLPSFIQAGKQQQLAVRTVNPEWLTFALGSAPFVKAIGWNNAATLLEGVAKAGQLLHRL